MGGGGNAAIYIVNYRGEKHNCMMPGNAAHAELILGWIMHNDCCGASYYHAYLSGGILLGIIKYVASMLVQCIHRHVIMLYLHGCCCCNYCSGKKGHSSRLVEMMLLMWVGWRKCRGFSYLQS